MKLFLRTLLGLCLAASFVSVAAAQEQSQAGMSIPKVMQITREYTMPGKAGMIHEKMESAFVQAMSRAKWPTHYIGMTSLSGKQRALFVTRYESLEAWEKVFVSDAKFAESTHGKLGCTACHGGDAKIADKDTAHQGVTRDPSAKPEQVCGNCHTPIVKNTTNGLHFTQNGYWTYLKTVGADVNSPAVKEAFANHCSTCHATCGDCHVSRPAYTGGGLLAGHTIKKIASSSDTCMACHGARVGDEYRGSYDGIDGDVHWTKLGMACTQCHKENSLHGDGQARATMFDKPEATCLDCHKKTLTDTTNTQHAIHKDKLACQVCHAAGAYKNCANCHVGKDAKGLPYSTLDPSWMDFKIGKNQNKTVEHPFDYVLVRHVPTNADLFKAYNVTFANPNAVPTWRPTTPHNIQRKTKQNASCDSCHKHSELFLTADKIKPKELDANRGVIVDQIPQ